jgi:uncharacterized RDD family membrane protein YckC
MRLVASQTYASPWKRLGAYFIDTFFMNFVQLLGSLAGSAVAVALVTQDGIKPEVLDTAAVSGRTFGYLFWGIVVWILNTGVMQGLSGVSLGKRFMGIELLNSTGQPVGILRSLARSCAYMFLGSLSIALMPYFKGYSALFSLPFFLCVGWAFFNEKRQTWVDLAFGSIGVEAQNSTETQTEKTLEVAKKVA